MPMGFEPEDEPLVAQELPDEVDPRVKNLPLYRQEVWLQAFNEALEEFGDRRKAEAIAWGEAMSSRAEDAPAPRGLR